jgi:hypothetical protein
VNDGEIDAALNREACTKSRDGNSSTDLTAWGAGRALGVEDAMFQVDPWEKAADCERALRLTIDPVHREKLTNIREFWISLAKKGPFLSEHEFAREAETIGCLHANLAALTSIH